MSKEIDEFINRTYQLSNRYDTGLDTGMAGASNKQAVAIDLYKSASLLKKAHIENKLDEQLDEVVGVLHVAQAMNVIGTNDLLELMDLLDMIKSEEKQHGDQLTI